MTIRPYADRDGEAVVRLALRAWTPVFASLEAAMEPGVYCAFYPDWPVQQRRAVEAALANPAMAVWVAEREGEVAGFVAVVLHRDDALGEVHMLAVDPAHQRAGVGTALTDFAVERMRAAGMAVAMIETGGDDGHAPARATYERAGFRALPVVRFFKKL